MYFGKLSIRPQLIAITVLPTVLLSIAYIITTFFTLSNFSSEKIHRDSRHIAESVSAYIVPYTETNNIAEIKKILCLSLKMSANIRQIALLNKLGEVQTSCGDHLELSGTKSLLSPVFHRSQLNSQLNNRRDTPEEYQEIYGYVKIYFENEPITRELSVLMYMIATLGVLGGVFGTLLGYFFFRKFALVMREMVQASESVERGSFPTKFSNILNGEIGKMQMAFLSMANSIIESTKHLETRINDRTQELQQKNKKIEEINEQRQVLIRGMNQSIEDERKKIAFDLHDTLNTVVLATIGHTRNARLIVTTADYEVAQDKLLEEIASIEINVSYFYSLSRDLVTNLRPEVLDEFGLSEALESMVEKQSKIDPGCQYSFLAPENFPKLTYDFNIVVYRIMQESLSNIAKHSHATTCRIVLAINEYDAYSLIELRIQDNGTGFDQHANLSRTGLVGMRERAESIDGILEINSVQNKGTEILLSAKFYQSKHLQIH